MRSIYTIFALMLLPIFSIAQEKIFSIGYGKTFVTGDSSTLNLAFDLNRIPGQTEKAGGYYFINELMDTTKRWRYYLKPTMDVNIGTGVASSPNNIAVGLPFGVAYDFKGLKVAWYFEGSPELVADKSFRNRLYYFTESTYIKYEPYASKNFLLNVLLGISNSNGVRHQVGITNTDDYGRLTVPVYLKMIFWKDSIKRKKYPNKAPKEFNRFSWINSFKYNNVYTDNRTVNPKKEYTFFSSKLDFYITPNIAINVTYFNGHEEPVFKQNNSLTFGFSIAR